MQVRFSNEKWWIADGNQHQGPFTVEDIRGKLESSEVTVEQLACPVGGDEWKSIEDWDILAAIDSADAGETFPPPPPIPPQSTAPVHDDQSESSDLSESTMRDNASKVEETGLIVPEPISTVVSDNDQQAELDNEPEESQSDNESAWAASLVIGGIILIGVVGWGNIFWGLGWIVTIVMGLATAFCGLMAVESLNKDETQLAGWGAATVVFGLVGYWFYGLVKSDDATSAVADSSAVASANPAAEATLRYWNAIPRCLNENGPQVKTRDQLVQFFGRCAARIETLPTKNVDSVAVQWGLEAANSLRRFGQACESISVAERQLLLRSIVNGYQGTMIDSVSDISRTYGNTDAILSKAADEMVYVWNQRSAQIRSQLTERYGMQFPVIRW